MDQLTKARLKLAALLAVSVGLIVWPAWFRSGDVRLQVPEQRKPMPRFSFPTLTGEQWSLEDYRGRIVLVNFWATWCGPCREETPDLVRVYAKYREHGVEIAGVSMDEDPDEAAPSFVRYFRVDYPILVPPVESTLTAAIQGLPTSFLVDTKGRIARTWIGAISERTLTSAIDQLLADQ